MDMFALCALRVICPRDISNKSIMLSKSLTKVCVWGGGGFSTALRRRLHL